MEHPEETRAPKHDNKMEKSCSKMNEPGAKRVKISDQDSERQEASTSHTFQSAVHMLSGKVVIVKPCSYPTEYFIQI